jgi:hypothetical protein
VAARITRLLDREQHGSGGQVLAGHAEMAGARPDPPGYGKELSGAGYGCFRSAVAGASLRHWLGEALRA